MGMHGTSMEMYALLGKIMFPDKTCAKIFYNSFKGLTKIILLLIRITGALFNLYFNNNELPFLFYRKISQTRRNAQTKLIFIKNAYASQPNKYLNTHEIFEIEIH